MGTWRVLEGSFLLVLWVFTVHLQGCYSLQALDADWSSLVKGNIAIGKTPQDITPSSFFHYFNFFGFYQKITFYGLIILMAIHL